MTCRLFVSGLAPLAQGELSPSERRTLAGHAHRCPACDAYLRSYVQTIALVRGAYPALDPTPTAA